MLVMGPCYIKTSKNLLYQLYIKMLWNNLCSYHYSCSNNPMGLLTLDTLSSLPLLSLGASGGLDTLSSIKKLPLKGSYPHIVWVKH